MTKSFCWAENLSKFGIVTCIIMSILDEVNCKDKLLLGYSKFCRNSKVFETISSPSLFQIQVLGIGFP